MVMRSFKRGMIGLALAVTMIGVCQSTALAWTGDIPAAPTGKLSEWNWPYMIQNYADPLPNGFGWSGTSLHTFDAANDSYIVYHIDPYGSISPVMEPVNQAMQPDPNGAYVRTHLNIMIAPKNEKFEFFKDATTGQYRIRIAGKTATTMDVYTSTFLDYDMQNQGTNERPIYGNVTPTLHTINISSYFDQKNETGGYAWSRMVWAKNVLYDPSYDGKVYSQNTLYGAKGGTDVKCSPLDVGCWISKVIGSMSDTMAGWFNGLANFCVTIFVPDGDYIKADFDDLKTTLENKLGFLTYPFTFFNDLFNAFEGTGTWCSPDDCAWHVTFMANSPMTFDLLALPHSGYGDIWSWFLNFLRGTTVFTLMFMLARKLQEVFQR